MPWKEQNKVDARRSFIDTYLQQMMSFTDLCNQYNISTKTVYKWRKRFYEGGYSALEDKSTQPHSHPKQLSEIEVCQVIKLKQLHLDQGPKKIHNLYNRAYLKEISLPSVERILDKAGYTEKQKRRKISSLLHTSVILEAKEPNDIWTIDFKGHWFGRGGHKCEPFTVVDQFTRYILYCLPLAKGDTDHVKAVFIELFKRYGISNIIKSDNGSPFAHGLSPRGITRLSNWLMSLGINLQRIEPAKPYQNGKHERMHRDLKRVVQKGSKLSHKEYCAALKIFQKEYNEQRPHEALDMLFPVEIYHPSKRKYQTPSKAIVYPNNLEVRKVNKHGQIKYLGNLFTISETLSGYLVALKELDDNHLSVYFCDQIMGTIDLKLKHFIADNRALQMDIKDEL